jgi:hypothetical protein
MLPSTVATLLDVKALTEGDWPSSLEDLRVRLSSQFSGRPTTHEGLIVAPDGHHVGWFVYYDEIDDLLEQHREFCEALSAQIGPPMDTTPTTAAWTRGRFLIESYAHPRIGRDPHCSHQLGISFTPASPTNSLE